MVMGNNKKRPVYLNLVKLRLPVTGVVSIIHRITGVLLVLLFPAAMYLLQRSLQSEGAYTAMITWLSGPASKVLLLAISWFFLQHFFSGVRHLFLDIDIGIDSVSARRTAWLTLILSAAIVIALGMRWWL
jgi:succinate dehydrogenase / fumarate reductase, cytochrome b subunit